MIKKVQIYLRNLKIVRIREAVVVRVQRVQREIEKIRNLNLNLVITLDLQKAMTPIAIVSKMSY